MTTVAKRLLIGSATIFALALAACGDGSTASTSPSSSGSAATAGQPVNNVTADATVVAQTGNSFSPQNVTVKVGQVVEWKNNDSIAHTVTFNGQDAISTSLLNPGQTWEVKFTTAGTYNYICSFHQPNMAGTVTVTA